MCRVQWVRLLISSLSVLAVVAAGGCSSERPARQTKIAVDGKPIPLTVHSFSRQPSFTCPIVISNGGIPKTVSAESECILVVAQATMTLDQALKEVVPEMAYLVDGETILISGSKSSPGEKTADAENTADETTEQGRELGNAPGQVGGFDEKGQAARCVWGHWRWHDGEGYRIVLVYQVPYDSKRLTLKPPGGTAVVFEKPSLFSSQEPETVSDYGGWLDQ